ncbi:protein ninH [Escherichia coli]|nr:protein ninH [Escherichia coli]
MTFTVKTIPDMLLEAYGNQTEVARILNCNRATVRKYIGDKEGKRHAIVNKEGKRHAIVNGVLMVHRGWGKDTDA